MRSDGFSPELKSDFSPASCEHSEVPISFARPQGHSRGALQDPCFDQDCRHLIPQSPTVSNISTPPLLCLSVLPGRRLCQKLIHKVPCPKLHWASLALLPWHAQEAFLVKLLSAWKARRPGRAPHHRCRVFPFLYRACHLGQAKCWIFQNITEKTSPHISKISRSKRLPRGNLPTSCFCHYDEKESGQAHSPNNSLQGAPVCLQFAGSVRKCCPFPPPLELYQD